MSVLYIRRRNRGWSDSESAGVAAGVRSASFCCTPGSSVLLRPSLSIVSAVLFVSASAGEVTTVALIVAGATTIVPSSSPNILRMVSAVGDSFGKAFVVGGSGISIQFSSSAGTSETPRSAASTAIRGAGSSVTESSSAGSRHSSLRPLDASTGAHQTPISRTMPALLVRANFDGDNRAFKGPPAYFTWLGVMVKYNTNIPTRKSRGSGSYLCSLCR